MYLPHPLWEGDITIHTHNKPTLLNICKNRLVRFNNGRTSRVLNNSEQDEKYFGHLPKVTEKHEINLTICHIALCEVKIKSPKVNETLLVMEF